MKKTRRFIITLTLMLLYAFRPVKIDPAYSMSHKPGTYEIGKNEVQAGRYVVTPRDNGKYSSYQIATDDSMDLEYTKEAHWIDSPRSVVLENGDYITLINCTAVKEK